MPRKGLGRRHAPDDRDRQHPLRAVQPTEIYTKPYRYWWDDGAWLDQGNTSSCVGHAWAHWIEDAPIMHPTTVTDPFSIYDGAQLRDEWSGEDYDGTSVRGGAKYLTDTQAITEYHWGFSVDDVVYALKNLGPVVVGTNWYERMFDPEWNSTLERFIIKPGGGIAGGHAYVLNGVNENLDVVRVKNSWGRSWGVDGRVSMTFNTLARLLAEDGEACIATETRLA